MRQCLDWAEQPLVLARELEDAFRRFDYDASGADLYYGAPFNGALYNGAPLNGVL